MLTKCDFQFVVPKMACNIIDRAMQAFGAEGLSQDQELASMYAQLRTLRLADVRVYLPLVIHGDNFLFIGTRCGKYTTWSIATGLMYPTCLGPHSAGWSKRTEASARVAQACGRVKQERGSHHAESGHEGSSLEDSNPLLYQVVSLVGRAKSRRTIFPFCLQVPTCKLDSDRNSATSS